MPVLSGRIITPSSSDAMALVEHGVVQRHGTKATKKLGARGGAYLAGLFACICIYNVITVVDQKISLLIKLFVVVV